MPSIAASALSLEVENLLVPPSQTLMKTFWDVDYLIQVFSSSNNHRFSLPRIIHIICIIPFPAACLQCATLHRNSCSSKMQIEGNMNT